MRALFVASTLFLAAAIPFPATATSAPPPAGTSFMYESGDSLLAKCRNKAPEYALACTAYIVGVVDGIRKDLFIGRGRQVCWPDRMSAQDARTAVVDYLVQWPDQRKAPASVLVSVALNDKYPCQK